MKEKVKDYEYFFHGAGCRIVKNKIICEYDFLSYEDGFSYQFSIWKLKSFIESFYEIPLNEKELKQKIEELVTKGFLKKLKIENRIFDIYIVDRNVNNRCSSDIYTE